MKELSIHVKELFDSVLDTVKESQSELSIAELGLVKKMRYYEADKTIAVYMNYPGYNPGECPACSVATGLMKNSIERDLKDALLEKFPGWTIEFI